METWLLFSLLAVLFAGMNAFLLKVIGMRNYNPSIVLLIRYGVATLFSAGLYCYTYWGNLYIDTINLWILV